VIAFAAALVPLILGHGIVSDDLRTGVAMLWLQKPVRPVRFFALRACEVTALAVAVALAFWGTGAGLIAAAVGPAPARELLAATPGVVVLVICISTLTFAFSAWGTRADSLLVLAFLFASTYSLVLGGAGTAALEWVALPVEAIGVFARSLGGATLPDLSDALLEVGRFLLLWALVGVGGLVVSTRSPLPREIAR
jgi:hypothetical protein